MFRVSKDGLFDTRRSTASVDRSVVGNISSRVMRLQMRSSASALLLTRVGVECQRGVWYPPYQEVLKSGSRKIKIFRFAPLLLQVPAAHPDNKSILHAFDVFHARELIQVEKGKARFSGERVG